MALCYLAAEVTPNEVYFSGSIQITLADSPVSKRDSVWYFKDLLGYFFFPPKEPTQALTNL